MDRFKLPTAYTILFVLIVLIAAVTWTAPVGKYQTATNAALGKGIPVADTYAPVETQSRGITAVLLTPIDGLYNHQTYTTRAIDIALFVLIIGGFLGVVNKTGAMDADIERVTTRLNGRGEWMISILMALFAAGGTTYGMAEEPSPFYMLLVPVMTAARFDPLVAAATVLLGLDIDMLGSTTNPFTAVIAANVAGIPFIQGILLRVILLLVDYVIRVYRVMRYARKVRNSSESSIVAGKVVEDQAYLLENRLEVMLEFTPTRETVLIFFAVSFVFIIYGVAMLSWWAAGISVVLLVTAVIVGVTARMGEETFTSTSIDGVRDLLSMTLIIGIAHGIAVVMNNGMITHTILHSIESLVPGFSTTVFVSVTCWLEVLLSFLVPSSSGLAALTMPVTAPSADFTHVQRDLVVTVYQSASGVVNLITSTSAVAMGGLAIARVPWIRYLRQAVPLLLILTMLDMIVLNIAAMV